MSKRTAMLIWGTAAAVASSVSYGVNPLGALKLYALEYEPVTVLLFRFGYASAALCLWMALVRQRPFLAVRDLLCTALLGVIFAVSSITFYCSFQSLGAGLASTLVFLYPIFVAFLMCAFFRERFSGRLTAATALAFGGVTLLANAAEARVTLAGLALAVLSALAYAVYIVFLRQARVKGDLVPVTFWTMFFTFVTMSAYAAARGGAAFVAPKTLAAVGWGLFLGVCPSLVSLVLLSYALRRIGPTPTAIYGALEPPTAVLVGCLIFGEPFSARIAVGIALILGAVALVILQSAGALVERWFPFLQGDER